MGGHLSIKKKGLVLALFAGAALVVTLVVAVPRSGTTFLSIGTAGTGGVYYPYGGGLAEIWSKNVPGVRAVAEVTAGSVENVRLAHRGETVVGEVMGDVAYLAYKGGGPFKGKQQGILAMAVMYPNILQIVTRKGSGIKNLTDLKGKTVSIGAPGSGTALMAGLVLEALGISMDTIDVRRLSFNENSNALRDGTIEAGFWVVAPETSSIMDLASTHDVQIVGLTPEQQKKVTDAHGFYSAWNLKGGVYRGIEKDTPTLGVWNVIIVQKSLPDELVFKLAEVLFEENDYMRKIHPFASYTTPENAASKSPIPLHPGAIKLLKEKGVEIPDNLIPRS